MKYRMSTLITDLQASKLDEASKLLGLSRSEIARVAIAHGLQLAIDDLSNRPEYSGVRSIREYVEEENDG